MALEKNKKTGKMFFLWEDVGTRAFRTWDLAFCGGFRPEKKRCLAMLDCFQPETQPNSGELDGLSHWDDGFQLEKSCHSSDRGQSTCAF